MTQEACEIDQNNQNLETLRVLTKALRFANIMEPAHIHRIKTEQGNASISGLFKSLKIAVSENWASEKTYFPSHQHPGWEIFYLYKGKMKLKINGKKVCISAKDRPFSFDARQRHSAYFPIDSHYLAMTIPGDKDWPEGG